MTKKNTKRAPAQADGLGRIYSPDLLPQMQSLLAALADIDCTYESDLETVRTSSVPDIIRHSVIETLQQRRQERRAPYLRELEELQRRMRVAV